MDNVNFNLPSKEFVEQNFNKIISELNSLKKQLNLTNRSEIKFYRNKDLKSVFGLSDNTIYEYREKGIIPYTKLGEIFYYPVQELNRILDSNSNFGKISNS